jgi:hypothetical protein
LKEKGFTQEVLHSLESGLVSVFDIKFAFNKWSLGEDFCKNILKLSDEQLNDFNFDLLKYRPDLTAGRLPMWVAVVELSLNQPLTGLGFAGIKSFLMEGGFANRSTHNTFFDLVLSSGLLSAMTYCVLIAYALKQSWVQDRTSFLLILYLFVASNFITFTMGGISFLSVVMFYLVVIHVTGSSAKLEQS